jgi:hypothetical protein
MEKGSWGADVLRRDQGALFYRVGVQGGDRGERRSPAMVEPFNGVGFESGRRNRGVAHRFGEGEAEQALGGTSFLGATGRGRVSR